MYDSKLKVLNIYNIEVKKGNNSLHMFTYNDLKQDRLMTTIPNFDYGSKIKYYLDKQILSYVWKGDLVEIDLISNTKKLT